MRYTYRLWMVEPLNRDEADLFLVRYDYENETQEFFADGAWHTYPKFGSILPLVAFPGRDTLGMVSELKDQLRRFL